MVICGVLGRSSDSKELVFMSFMYLIIDIGTFRIPLFSSVSISPNPTPR